MRFEGRHTLLKRGRMRPIFFDAWENACLCEECENMVHEFEKAVKQDGRINLQREGEICRFLCVRCTYDEVTSSIGCDQEAYNDCLMVRCDTTNATACKLPTSASRLRPLLLAYPRSAWHKCRACLLWLVSIFELPSRLYLNSATWWAVWLSTCQKRHSK